MIAIFLNRSSMVWRRLRHSQGPRNPCFIFSPENFIELNKEKQINLSYIPLSKPQTQAFNGKKIQTNMRKWCICLRTMTKTASTVFMMHLNTTKHLISSLPSSTQENWDQEFNGLSQSHTFSSNVFGHWRCLSIELILFLKTWFLPGSGSTQL